MPQLRMTISVVLLPAAAFERSICRTSPKPAERDDCRLQQASSSWRSTQLDKGCRWHATIGGAMPAYFASLFGHQIVDRDLLRNRPLIDHARLALLGIDDHIATLVLIGDVLAEGTRPEQRGLVVHFLELRHHRLGIRRLGPLDGLRPAFDQHISVIAV